MIEAIFKACETEFPKEALEKHVRKALGTEEPVLTEGEARRSFAGAYRSLTATFANIPPVTVEALEALEEEFRSPGWKLEVSQEFSDVHPSAIVTTLEFTERSGGGGGGGGYEGWGRGGNRDGGRGFGPED